MDIPANAIAASPAAAAAPMSALLTVFLPSGFSASEGISLCWDIEALLVGKSLRIGDGFIFVIRTYLYFLYMFIKPV